MQDEEFIPLEQEEREIPDADDQEELTKLLDTFDDIEDDPKEIEF